MEKTMMTILWVIFGINIGAFVKELDITGTANAFTVFAFPLVCWSLWLWWPKRIDMTND
ncbi:MAG: hypothetical protein GY832_01505 [Chloroflexi bacterium]|nr:hypothetical protein [Chloroflexota bacterium]